MRALSFIILGAALSVPVVFVAQSRTTPKDMPPKAIEGSGWNTLDGEAKRVVEACGTERAFTGKYNDHKAKGTYTCVRCDSPLFDSSSKFNSGSGWPAFDDTLPGSVRELKDPDGFRTEIRCRRCDGHLGHVFRGERMTKKDTRHCVNSVSMNFEARAMEEAFFAGGCFWGVELLLEDQPGVISVVSGYMGGHKASPTYKEVVYTDTGHAETVRVRFDPTKTSYATLAKRFFEIHDPTQVDRQGPDRGPQYRSAVFVTGDAQKKAVLGLISKLEAKGLKVATKIHPAEIFWPAEDYHQDYYVRTGKTPYCHEYTPRF